jgi:hypothetical protein
VPAEPIRSRGPMKLAAALAVVLGLVLLPSSTAVVQGQTAVVPSTFFGVAPQNTITGDELSRMAQGRVGTLRMLLDWSVIDPTSADDNNWAGFDPVVASAARSGITVLPFIFNTPTWVVNDLDHRGCTPPGCGLYAPAGQAALDQWQRFLREAAQRYGPNGAFWAEHPELPVTPITTWQLWNEQNSFSFYKPKIDAGAYATLLRTGSEAIRSVDPNAKILLGGMFGTPGGVKKPKYFAWKFLRKLYKVPGIEGQFDGIGVHPYAARMVRVIEQTKLMHKETVRAGDPTEMWVTEVGWSSGNGANPLDRGKKGQATRLREVMTYFIGKQAKFNVQNVTWFAWRDLGGEPICEWCGKAGLFKANALTPKPSWDALMDYTGGS